MLNGLRRRLRFWRDPYAHIVIDAGGRVLEWDAEATRLFGWSFGEVLNRRLSDFLMPLAWRASHEAGLDRLRAGGDSKLFGKEVSVQALTAAGETIDVRLIIGRLSGHNGNARYVATLARSTEEFVVLTPSGVVESATSAEKAELRRRQDEIATLLARAQSDVVIELRVRARTEEAPVNEP